MVPSGRPLQSFGLTSAGSPGVVVVMPPIVVAVEDAVLSFPSDVVVRIVEGVVKVVGFSVTPGVVGYGEGSHTTEWGVSQMWSQLLKSLSGWQ